MPKKFAVGIVVKDRLELTQQTLTSLYYSTQDKNSYDVFLIDNGSRPDTTDFVKDYVNKNLLPIKNTIIIPEVSIPVAWNLFLALSKDYEYRLKFDNDLIIPGTIKSVPKIKLKAQDMPSAQKNPGCVVSTPFFGHRAKKTVHKIQSHDSNFLDVMADFGKQFSADVMSLIPVSPGQSFNSMLTECTKKTWKGQSYLFGACMQISKKAFDKLGYFDERLPRRIDIEYSQRAMRHGLNIGYHNSYYVVHPGAGHTTESPGEIQKKYADATEVEPLTLQNEYVVSKWEENLSKLNRLLKKNPLVVLK